MPLFILPSLTLLFLIPTLAAKTIRVATYNVSMSQRSEGQLSALLRTGDDPQARRVAEIIQILQPDVLLLNEFDFDQNGTAATRMNDRYFKISQNGRTPQDYPYRYVAISNTGIHSGFDLDNNGRIDSSPGDLSYGGDAFGFGEFPGKFGMAVFSKFPLQEDAIRTFEKVLWKDMPNHLIPPGFYSPEEEAIFRLSSKSHWDIPIQLFGSTFHFLVSHPTPPVFDGSEDRNGRRNHDEIRLWADYLTPDAAAYLGGGLPLERRFIIAGDQNADPTRGDSFNSAIHQLLQHPRVNASFTPARSGASTTAKRFDTSTFGLRVDYVLPSRLGFHLTNGAVFWPLGNDDGAQLVTSSDHRPVYLDLQLIPLIEEAVKKPTVRREGEQFRLHWQAQAEVSYRIEKSLDLKNDTWQAMNDLTLIRENHLASVILPSTASGQFYRIVAFYE